MLSTVALFLLLVLLFWLLFSTGRPKNFPPGPRPLPILGNLLELSLENPVADFQRLAKRYGNIYSIFMGPRPAVILNGLEAIKEALVNKAADFSGRPQSQMVNRAVQIRENAPGLILADYTPNWKEQRRFSLMTLRNFGLGKQSMEQRILGELEHITNILEQSVGGTMDPQLLFHNAASNVMCQVLFAKRYSYDDTFPKFFVKYFHDTSKIINGFWGMIYDFVPVVRSLPLPFQQAFKLFKIAHKLYDEEVLESKKTRIPGAPKHFIDCYLDEADKRGNEALFTEDQLATMLVDIHYAGTDTTANTTLFILFYLINYPEVQERCQQEIDRVLQGKDRVSFEDRHQMPYVQAVIHEIQRMANTVPLGVAHCTSRDTELMGFSIPKGTIVITNMASVLFEEGKWKFPHEFNPENFLSHQGEFMKPEAFIPFSVGTRMCLGEGLARMELFLITVSLLRKFQFVWPEDAGEPDFTPIFGVTQTPKPFRMKIQLRLGSS
ncbi:cytochrome P450 2D15-like [Salarias fasciatus]|uniref:cytochrome P450 2D15-like n=1 Tax=Salarias fasciatus TaxID=181472 RepID=UPI001176637E|nr:cytochrome P450 2D15-like [Salarias fasciatus]